MLDPFWNYRKNSAGEKHINFSHHHCEEKFLFDLNSSLD